MSPERRRRLLETAASEFATKGYQGASLNRIISECGISKSSFYYFIGSKGALFDAVIDEIGRRLTDRLDIPEPVELEGPGFWDTIATLLARLLTLAAQERWSVDLGRLFHLADVPADGSPALSRVNKAMNTWLAGAIEMGRRCGAIRDDLPAALQTELALSVLWVMDRWGLQHVDDPDRDAAFSVFAAQFATLRRMLEPN